MTFVAQIAAFCICAAAHLAAFLRWTQWSQDEKAVGWRLYGWFTGLATLGSSTGAIAYGCRLRQLEAFYIAEDLDISSQPTLSQRQEKAATRAVSRRFAAAHFALFPFELFFVVLTQLIVLSRMQHFVLAKLRRPELWAKARQSLLAVVILLTVVGIFGNFASSFYYNEAANFSVDAAHAYAINNTQHAAQLRARANEKHSIAGTIASIQRFSEVSTLLIIILAFLIVGHFSSQAIASALRTLLHADQNLFAITGDLGDQTREVVSSASDQGRKLFLKVVVTTVFVFLSLLLRASFMILYAIAQSLQNNSHPCAESWCDTCKNIYSNIHGWILYTPAFQSMIILVASPIAMLVGLWGMSNVRALEDMVSLQETDTTACQLDKTTSSTSSSNGDVLL